MKRIQITIISGLLLAICSIGLLQAGTVKAATLSTCGGWKIQPSPSISNINQLVGASAAFLNDAWVVGNYLNPNGYNLTLTEHWDGSQWRVISSPNVGNNSSYLYGVVQNPATHEAWAVGTSINLTDDTTLIEYWNGTKWSVISSPNVPGVTNALSAVTFVSSNDIWAVGNTYSNKTITTSTLIEHWNGIRWSIVPSPNVKGASSFLSSVAAASATDIWAVGYFTRRPSVNKTLTEHWDGNSWQIIASPNSKRSITNMLSSVTAIAANNAWAVGNIFQNGGDRALIEHWNGTQWSIVPASSVSGDANDLIGVAAVNANAVWAVGYYYNPQKNLEDTLIERWNGTQWSAVSSPNVKSFDNSLTAVTVAPGGSLWTAGFSLNTSNYNVDTLIEFNCG